MAPGSASAARPPGAHPRRALPAAGPPRNCLLACLPQLLSESIMWDHACVLVQLGLLDPAGLPVTGGEQADKLLEMAQGGGPIPSNALINAAAHK